jgi:hypothetical protein
MGIPTTFAGKVNKKIDESENKIEMLNVPIV